MKKFLALSLALITVLGVFAGCNTTSEPQPTIEPIPVFAVPMYDPTGAGMVAAGKKHTAGLRSDGTVLATGNNENGQTNVSSWENIAHIDASDTMTVGSSWDGKAFATIENEEIQNAISAWSDIVMITAGDNHVVGLKSDGTVVAAGDNQNGQCNVSSWSDIVMIAADANHTVALQKNGKVVATGDNSSRQCVVDEWEEVVMIDTARYHTLALKNNTTAYATGAFDLEQINVAGWHHMKAIYAGETKSVALTDIGYLDASPVDTDVMGVTFPAHCAVGSQHIAVMRTDGTVETTGSNVELQCEVKGWQLRPYMFLGALAGFAPSTPVSRAKKAISSITANNEIVIKDANGVLSDDAIIHTGCDIYTGDFHYGVIAIKGDADGDGLITEKDAKAVEEHISGVKPLSGAYLAAATIFGTDNEVHAQSVEAIRDHVNGKSRIPQFAAITVDEYGEKLAEAKANNAETVGWIKIEGTEIDHPIMYNSDLFYYNSHDTEGHSSSHGSVYTYYNALFKNNVITAHNMRKAKSNRMFHTLHHVQEYNLGSTECEAKYCDDYLTDDLPDFSTFSGRVFTINIYGIEARWEVFSMYETPDDEPKETLFNNVWWPQDRNGNGYFKQTDEEIQEWIDTQLEKSEYKFPAVPTVDDMFITLMTCATEYGGSNAQSRLYMFLRKI